MFSGGWVWLVTDGTGQLGVLGTYGAGTLLVQDRNQRFDTTSPEAASLGGRYQTGSTLSNAQAPSFAGLASAGSGSSPVSGSARAAPTANPIAGARSLHISARSGSIYDGLGARDRPFDNLKLEGQTTKATQLDKLGEVLTPLFCVGVHERAWMAAGFGVWGKERYLREFWSVLDWEQVSKNYRRVNGDGKPREPPNRAY